MPQTLNSLPGWERKCQGCLGALLVSQVGRPCLHVVLVDLACGNNLCLPPLSGDTSRTKVPRNTTCLQSVTAHILGERKACWGPDK